MYRHILIAIENSEADRAVLNHVEPLARLTGAKLLLVHVADGWAARHFDELKLRESEEMRQDREYLDRCATDLAAASLDVDAILASGDPAVEICAAADRESCDLIAMATHGHGFLNDVVRGSVANQVRHRTMVPVLMVRGVAPAR